MQTVRLETNEEEEDEFDVAMKDSYNEDEVNRRRKEKGKDKIKETEKAPPEAESTLKLEEMKLAWTQETSNEEEQKQQSWRFDFNGVLLTPETGSSLLLPPPLSQQLTILRNLNFRVAIACWTPSSREGKR